MLYFIVLQIAVLAFAILEIAAHQYNITTGSHLTYSLLIYSMLNFSQIGSVMASEANAFSNYAFALTTLVTMVLPWIMIVTINQVRRIKKFRYVERTRKPAFVSLALSVLFYTSLFAMPPGSKDLFISQNSVYSIFQTFLDTVSEDSSIAGNSWNPPVNTLLNARIPGMQKKNLVIIVLESTRADATSVYNTERNTTPFLKKLADKSLVAQNAFAVIPHTSKSLVAIHCGIEPNTDMPITEAEDNGIAARCLPTLLKNEGYRTVYFQSPTETFENRRGLVKNFGHEEFYPGESPPVDDAEKVNYFGYEDKIMLKPSEKWLKRHKEKHRGRPFMATFLTGASHHNYGLPSWYRPSNWHTDYKFNRYLNTVHLADRFVEQLFDQFKRLGMYKNTVFVLVGDHGEGFIMSGVIVMSYTMKESKYPLSYTVLISFKRAIV